MARTNHHTGIAAAAKIKRREEAEQRQAAYDKLSIADKLTYAKPGSKQHKKLLLQRELSGER